jgi:hypothetical protein
MRALALAASLVAAPLGPAAGQWFAGLEVGTGRYGGSARDTSNGSGPPTFRPGDATMFGIRVGRTIGGAGVAIRASKGTPGLTAAGGDLAISDKSSGELLEFAGFVTFRVRGVRPSGAIRAELGPALHLWKKGDDTDSRLGASGALAYEWPVAGHLSGAIAVEGAVSKSWFDAGDLPPEYALRATWRYGVTLGLRYLFSRQHPPFQGRQAPPH